MPGSAGVIAFADRLSSHIEARWGAARDAKRLRITPILERCARLQDGLYDAELRARFEAAGEPDLYDNLVREKTRQLKALLRDALQPMGDRAWDLEPTPAPDLPAEVRDGIVALSMRQFLPDMAEIEMGARNEQERQGLRRQLAERVQAMSGAMAQQMDAMIRDEAESRCDRLERLVEDELAEGGWDEAISELIEYLSVFPLAVLKGPILETVTDLKWDRAGPRLTERVKPVFRAVSPWDIYPGPNSRVLGDDYICEVVRWGIEALRVAAQGPGWITSRVDEAIRDFITSQRPPASPVATEGTARAALELRPGEVIGETEQIEVLEYWDRVPGEYLLEWAGRHEASLAEIGFPRIEADQWYPICAIRVGSYVVHVSPVRDPLGRYPYQSCCFETRSGSVWGVSPPEILESVQRAYNHAMRNMAVNLGFISGPMVSHDSGASTIPVRLQPRAVLPYDGAKTLHGRSPTELFNVSSVISECIAVREDYRQRADDLTGIPRYGYGSPQTTGAAETMGGLDMLLTMSSKSIKAVLGAIDRAVKGCLEQLVALNYMYSPDPSIRGDIRIVPKGALQVMLQDRQQKGQAEMLGWARDPAYAPFFKPEGVAYLLRQRAHAADFPEDKIIVSDEELRQGMARQAVLPGAEATSAQGVPARQGQTPQRGMRP